MHLSKLFILGSSLSLAGALPSKRAAPDFYDYGELRVSVTTDYTWAANDNGSKAKRDLNVWNPKKDTNLRPLGSVLTNNHGDTVNGKRATVVVGLNPNQPPKDKSKPALMNPTDWSFQWSNKGYGWKYNLTIFSPLCADGYVPIGDVGVTGFMFPEKTASWCVRQDLAKQGTYKSSSSWDTTGSKASSLSLWEVIPVSTGIAGSDIIPLYAGNFRSRVAVGVPPRDAPWVLGLQIPRNFVDFTAKVPAIAKGKIPFKGDLFSETNQAKITLPLTTLFDSTDAKILQNIRSPFYTISRSAAWYVEGIWENNSAGNLTRSDEVTYGFSQTQTDSMQNTVGVSMTASSGIGVVDFSLSLNYQFTRSSTTSFNEYTSNVKKEEFTVPPYYTTVMFCRLLRTKTSLLDGTVIRQDDNLASGEFHLSGVKN